MGNRWENEFGVTAIGVIARTEKARSEDAMSPAGVCDSASNGRFSRSGGAIDPKNMPPLECCRWTVCVPGDNALTLRLFDTYP